MNLNFQTIIPIITVVSALVAGIFVLLNNPKASLNRIYFFICFNLAAWFSFYTPSIINMPESFTLWWFKIGYCFISFLPIMCFTFVITYLNIPKRDLIYKVNAFVGMTLSVMSLSTDLIVSGINKLPTLYPKAGELHFILIIHCIYLVAMLHKYYIQAIQNKNTSQKQLNHLKYMFIAMLILSLSMWDFQGNYGYKIYQIGPITGLLFVLISTIAIVKHKLMDIEIVIRKGLVYSILVSIFTLTYFLIVICLEKYFHKVIGYHDFGASLIMFTTIAIIFIPLKNRLQSIIDRIFFRGSQIEIVQENEMLRREVAQTEKLKAVALLASGIAHEIKNPLTALKTFTEFLPSKIDDKEFLKKYSAIANNEVKRINNLVHELLDFAKPSPANLRPTNLTQLLDETLEFLNNDFIKRKIKVIKDYKIMPDTKINIDQIQFKQALLNILLNAIDAMENGGYLHVTADISSDQFVRFRIKDTGKGITKDDLPHIFDPFFTKKPNGTGLGLSITHEIIKRQNGKIYAESHPAKGTTFTIILPHDS